MRADAEGMERLRKAEATREKHPTLATSKTTKSIKSVLWPWPNKNVVNTCIPVVIPATTYSMNGSILPT